VWKCGNALQQKDFLHFASVVKVPPIPHFEKCRNRCGTAIGHTSTLENQEISLNARMCVVGTSDLARKAITMTKCTYGKSARMTWPKALHADDDKQRGRRHHAPRWIGSAEAACIPRTMGI
jgi:hypothetical protein